MTVLVISSFSFGFLFHSVLNSPNKIGSGSLFASVMSFFEPRNVILSLPINLRIPKINIDATIEQVDLTTDWSIDVPKKINDAAWFDLGPYPGENGSAVIVGHYGWKNGEHAVFDDLHQLNKGDKIYVEDEKGLTSTFVVSEVKTYDQNDNASGVFTSNDGKAHLNLITCEGVWNKTKKSYSSRLVVFSDKEIK